jgi:hypothetical protein
LTTGHSGGVEPSGIAWQLAIDDYRDDGFDGPSSDAPGVPRLYRVRVTVSWREGVTPRSLSLDSLRLDTARRP